MRINQIVLGLLAAAASASAPAEPTNVGSNTITGRVETVYAREYPGCFIEKKLLRNTAGKDLWAEVRFGEQPQGGASTELARIGPDTAIERGDIVEMRLAESVPVIQGVLREANRVSRLVARHDTLQALLFGLPGALQSQSPFIPVATATRDNPDRR